MSNRYKFWNPDGIYFISFSVVNWIDVFIRNTYKDILLDSIEYCRKEKGLQVHAFVVMTSHVHMIISKSGTNNLEDIMRDLKKFTAFKIIGAIMNNPCESRKVWLLKLFEESGRFKSNTTKYQFWQHDNHPIELTDNRMIEVRLNYLHNNPVEAGFVFQPEEYVYSSAIDYAGGKGYLSIELLN
jgi:putative transposase